MNLLSHVLWVYIVYENKTVSTTKYQNPLMMWQNSGFSFWGQCKAILQQQQQQIYTLPPYCQLV